MGDVAVESPVNNLPPHKKAAPSTIPTIDHFEGVPTSGGDDYANLKKLQRQLESVALPIGIDELLGSHGHIGISSYKRSISKMNRGKHYHSVSFLKTANILQNSRSLKRELVRAQEEIKRIQSVPLVIGQFMEAIDQK